MPEPEFREEQGTFVACFLRATQELKPHGTEPITEKPGGTAEKNLLYFCGVPRTRQALADFLGVKSVLYAVKAHVLPLVEQGPVRLTVPEHPRSPKQKYVATRSE